MTELIRWLNFDPNDEQTRFKLLDCEWLITNGLGGYSSLSLSGTNTRKYHGILVASLPAPLGRIVMLNHVQDKIKIGDQNQFSLSYLEVLDESSRLNFDIPLIEFRLTQGLPVWTYFQNEVRIEKSIFFVHAQNTVHLIYHYVEGNHPIQLIFEPFFNFRHYESPVNRSLSEQLEYSVKDSHYEITGGGQLPPLRIFPSKEVKFIHESNTLKNVLYLTEAERGYDSMGDLKSFGSFLVDLQPNEKISFIISTEDWEILRSFTSEKAYEAEKQRRQFLLNEALHFTPPFEKESQALELVLAADQFIIIPTSRISDVAWNRAIGEEARSIIAGYHWFTDWGRDTMISLEGLALITGRIQEANYILRTFIHHLKDGLIPNMFPDGDKEGVYYTADATLWFFHALDRYVAYSHDESLINVFLPKIVEILNFHIQGTKFGIHMDSEDALLTQGVEGYALTWMDAKVGDLVVTPRRGKAVEINALWYNALRLAIEWLEKEPNFKEDAKKFESLASQCFESFNRKFWNSEKGYLFDVIDGLEGNDSSCRPNQLFTISLKYPVLKKEYWEPIIQVVQKKLLTPLGLRSLSSDHPNYKVLYGGNLFLRDTAYHQGTIWAWLIGPFIDAWLKIYPEKKEEAKNFLKMFENHLNDACIGSINEIFDAESPYNHRGCIAQAWSVAEILRCIIKTSQ